jgi:hypothetical protein
VGKVWLFGGSKKPFGKKLTTNLDTVYYGRHNTDYYEPLQFINQIKEIPDTVIFNFGNHRHDGKDEDFLTKPQTWKNLTDDTMVTQYFALRLVEWLFSKHSNISIVWITSMSPYDSHSQCYFPMYKISRAIEHTIMEQFNKLKQVQSKNNIISGFCVGSNTEGTPELLNSLIHNKKLTPGIFSMSRVDDSVIISGEAQLYVKYYEEYTNFIKL